MLLGIATKYLKYNTNMYAFVKLKSLLGREIREQKKITQAITIEHNVLLLWLDRQVQ